MCIEVGIVKRKWNIVRKFKYGKFSYFREVGMRMVVIMCQWGENCAVWLYGLYYFGYNNEGKMK